ncbi:unnamed protein product [Phaedon cochleariae]|uniref:Uncharacterized protein n=1 Tax=Phaedon cochleariae TaxID=80249 RepID=A0A9N9SFR5_PHACE|nr:unnamed protein product [Phaedon cochleariae]
MRTLIFFIALSAIALAQDLPELPPWNDVLAEGSGVDEQGGGDTLPSGTDSFIEEINVTDPVVEENNEAVQSDTIAEQPSLPDAGNDVDQNVAEENNNEEGETANNAEQPEEGDVETGAEGSNDGAGDAAGSIEESAGQNSDSNAPQGEENEEANAENIEEESGQDNNESKQTGENDDDNEVSNNSGNNDDSEDEQESNEENKDRNERLEEYRERRRELYQRRRLDALQAALERRQKELAELENRYGPAVAGLCDPRACKIECMKNGNHAGYCFPRTTCNCV